MDVANFTHCHPIQRLAVNTLNIVTTEYFLGNFWPGIFTVSAANNILFKISIIFFQTKQVIIIVQHFDIETVLLKEWFLLISSFQFFL